MTDLSVSPLRIAGPTGPMLAWWHATSASAAPAVVLCGPWGDEDLGAYRGLRELALHLAGAGWHVLRFDGPGQGDSFDPPFAPDADAWALWHEALDAALNRARDLAGQSRIALIGLRLGALLAAQVAARRDDVTALALVLPPSSAKAWLREAMMLGGGRIPKEASSETDLNQDTWLGGLHLSAATLDALRAATWPVVSTAKVDELLCLDRCDPPSPQQFQALWSTLARRVTYEPRDDLSELVAIAHDSHWPPALSSRLSQWLQGARGRMADAPMNPAPAVPQPNWAESSEAAATFDGVRETVVTLPMQVPCVGVLCQRAGDTGIAEGDAGLGLVLLSSGEERRVGPHRLWVPLARERARRGDIVLRLDFPGIGDSPAREPGQTDDVYDARVGQDLAVALEWLRREHRVRKVMVLGLCSGGYHAWRAAVTGLPVDAVVPINPLVFHWRTGMSLNPMDHQFGQIGVVSGLGSALRVGGNWRRLLRGEIRVRLILTALVGRLGMALRHMGRNLARRCHWPLREDLATELRGVLKRGINVHFIFAENESGLVLLRELAGSALTRGLKDGGLRMTKVGGADHTFAGATGRLQLYRELHAWLDSHQDPGVPQA